jgi:hypothetical protein
MAERHRYAGVKVGAVLSGCTSRGHEAGRPLPQRSKSTVYACKLLSSKTAPLHQQMDSAIANCDQH